MAVGVRMLCVFMLCVFMLCVCQTCSYAVYVSNVFLCNVSQELMQDSHDQQHESLLEALNKPQPERTGEETAAIKRYLWPRKCPYKQADVEQAARLLFGTAHDGITNTAVYDIRSSLLQ
jgi:hypothetical protein